VSPRLVRGDGAHGKDLRPFRKVGSANIAYGTPQHRGAQSGVERRLSLSRPGKHGAYKPAAPPKGTLALNLGHEARPFADAMPDFVRRQWVEAGTMA
jgi:hypothetical protein